MIKFYCNFYYLKNKIYNFETCTFEGRESDKELEKLEKHIIPVLQPIIAKNPKIKVEKKGVFFIEIDNCKWLESGSFKDWDKVELSIVKSDCTPAEFIKTGKQQIKDDAKSLASLKGMDEEDYS